VPRFKLTIEYAGTRYSGWQMQKNARTVEGEIDRAVRAVTGRKDFELYGSGRTDAGVHARAQVAHLDVSTTLPPAALVARINAELPSDINLLEAIVVPHRFHARHDAVARRYLYQIARRRTAFAKAFVWWVKEDLQIDRMRTAAAAFVGMRDFQSFINARGAPPPLDNALPRSFSNLAAGADSLSSRGPQARAGVEDAAKRSTLVLIERLTILEDGDLILVGIEGSHFLWKMVRRIVGVLVEIGRGALDAGAAAAFMADRSADPARLTAPPSGLFLEHVWYAGEPRDIPLTPATPIETRNSKLKTQN
jgi:tRNA pseudouridine38-40 synthase